LDRHADYGPLSDQRVHDFRTNGQFTLPVGPTKKFLGNSSGILARLTENWSAGWIFNANTGAPVTISGNTSMYGYYVLGGLVANSPVDVVGPFDTKGKVNWAQGASSGVFFSGTNGAALKQLKDPQCLALPSSLQSSCTLSAIADATTGQILLQNAQPGKRGNLGLRSVEGPGLWRFDANLAKSVKVSEGKALLFRIDATDVFNHPEPATPVLDRRQQKRRSIGSSRHRCGSRSKLRLHKRRCGWFLQPPRLLARLAGSPPSKGGDFHLKSVFITGVSLCFTQKRAPRSF
jgi:hypothetical protein